MEENKNIDQFFADRLGQDPIDNEDWNLPSDDIWEAAKVDFPVPEKKKKRGFWLFFTGIFLLLSLSLGRYFSALPSNQTNPQISSTKLIQKTNTKEETILESDTDAKSEKQILNEKSSNKEINKTIEFQEQPKTTKNKTESIQTQNIKPKKSPLKLQQSTNTVSDIYSQSIQNTLNGSSSPLMKNEEATHTVPNQMPSVTILDKSEIKSIPMLNISLASKDDFNLLEQPINFDLSPSTKGKESQEYFREEIGVSHLFSLLNLGLKYGTIETDNPSDVIEIDHQYNNLNLHYERWLSPKWSLSSAIYASSIDLNLNFSIEDTLDQEIYDFMNREINDIVDQSYLNDGDEYAIEFKNGNSAHLNEILNLKGDLDLSLRAIQIPVYFNRHWQKKRFEYVAGVGLSVDLLKLDLEVNDLAIFREEELITQDFIPSINTEYKMDYSLYFQTGMRINITKQFNLGLNARISVLEPIFSGVEAGLYYRFNR